MEQIRGWKCEVLADGCRVAVGPGRRQGPAFVVLHPSGGLESLSGAHVPPEVLAWLLAERYRRG